MLVQAPVTVTLQQTAPTTHKKQAKNFAMVSNMKNYPSDKLI